MHNMIFTIWICIQIGNSMRALGQDLPPAPPPFSSVDPADYIAREFQEICDLNGKKDFYKIYKSIEFFKIESYDTISLFRKTFVSKVNGIPIDSLWFQFAKKGANSDSVFTVSAGDTLLSSIKYFDGKRNEIEEVFLDHEGEIKFRTNKEYDEQNRIVKEYSINIDQKFIYETILTKYATEGEVSVTKINHNDEIYGGTATFKTEYFDRFGRLFKFEVSKSGNVINLIKYKWNSQNLVETITSDREINNKILNSKNFNYNELGFPITLLEEENGQVKQRYVIKYNK